MKVFVINPFFDNHGLHKKGEVCDVQTFNASYMQLVEEEKPKEQEVDVVDTQDVKKPVKRKTTTRKKKG